MANKLPCFTLTAVASAVAKAMVETGMVDNDKTSF